MTTMRKMHPATSMTTLGIAELLKRWHPVAFFALFVALGMAAILHGEPAGAQPRTPNVVPAEMKYIKLIGATNYVQELRGRKDAIRPGEAILATKMACDGLKQLADDEAFIESLKIGAPAAESHGEATSTLRSHLARFLDDFLRPEIDLLTKAGLSARAIDQIVKDGFDLASQAYIGKWGELTTNIPKTLKVFTSEVCRAADEAKQIAATKSRDSLTRLGIGVGAAAVIVIDAASASAVPPVAAVAAISLSWGFTALTESVKSGP